MQINRISLKNQSPTGLGMLVGAFVGITIVFILHLNGKATFGIVPSSASHDWIFFAMPAAAVGALVGFVSARLYHRLFRRGRYDEWLDEERYDLLRDLDSSAAHYAFFSRHDTGNEKRRTGVLALLTDQHLILAEMEEADGRRACETANHIGDFDCQGLIANYVLPPAHTIRVIPWTIVHSIVYREKTVHVSFSDEKKKKDRKLRIACAEESLLFNWRIESFITAVQCVLKCDSGTLERPYKQKHRHMIRALVIFNLLICGAIAIYGRDPNTSWFDKPRFGLTLVSLVVVLIGVLVSSLRKRTELVIFEAPSDLSPKELTHPKLTPAK